MLLSVDAFSGCGGNAYAFSSFASPELYCEIDSNVTPILHTAMRRGIINCAPVHSDIRTLLDQPGYQELSERGIDLFSASWPCQGNSTCGNRGGMMHEGSGLIRDVVRIVNTSMPKILFLENVPQVLGNGSVDYILRELRMYDVAWAVLKACDVGRPHVRKRFFAVAVLRCAEARHVLGNAVAVSKAHDLRSPDHEPRRMLDVNTTANVRRWKAMGNSVVPACSKRAFEVLGDIHLDPCRLSLPVLPGTKLPLCGYFNGRMYENEVPTVKQTYANVTFDSQLYKPPSGHRPHPTHNADILFEGVRSVPFWSTPRTCSNMSHLLTRRSMGDLGTQLRFERETPDDDRRGTASAEFAEWLMVNPPASWPLSPVLPTVP